MDPDPKMFSSIFRSRQGRFEALHLHPAFGVLWAVIQPRPATDVQQPRKFIPPAKGLQTTDACPAGQKPQKPWRKTLPNSSPPPFVASIAPETTTSSPTAGSRKQMPTALALKNRIKRSRQYWLNIKNMLYKNKGAMIHWDPYPLRYSTSLVEKKARNTPQLIWDHCLNFISDENPYGKSATH